jgi:hypothetical protein
MDTGVRFFHVSDELAFLEWLRKISCVESIDGEGQLGPHRPPEAPAGQA